MRKKLLLIAFLPIVLGSFAQSHFSPVISGNPEYAMNVYIWFATDNMGQILEPGDEVGVFCGTDCVGATELTATHFRNGTTSYVSIVAKRNTGPDEGYVVGEDILFRIWDADKSIELTAHQELYPDGTDAFSDGGSYWITLLPTAFDNAWCGYNSNSPLTADNWAVGAVPSSSDNVSIPKETTNTISVGGAQTLAVNNLSIMPSAALQNAGTLNVGGNLSFESAENQEPTGALINTGTLNVTGTTTVKRYLSPVITGADDGEGGQERYNAYDWHYVASPIAGSTVNPFAKAFVYAYDESGQQWSIKVKDDAMTTAQGYAVQFPTTTSSAYHKISFTGTLNSGSKSVGVTNSGSGTYPGYNLIGNPYPCAIDWDQVDRSGSNVANAIYLWDFSSQNYQSYVDGSGTASGIIPAMQGFFVEASANGTLNFDPTCFNTSNSVNFKSIGLVHLINLKCSGEHWSDETLIRFGENYTANFDLEYDARKFHSINEEVPALFTRSDDEAELSVNSLPKERMTDEFTLFLEAPEGEYVLSLVDFKGFEQQGLELIDRETGSALRLDGEAGYQFSHSGGSTNRFVIKLVSTLKVDKLEKPMPLLIRTENNQLILTAKAKVDFGLYTLQGQMMTRGQLNAGDKAVISENVRGICILKTSSEQGVQVTKLTIK